MSPASKAYLASGLATGAAFTLTFDVVGIFAWAVDMEFRRATADDYPAIFRLQTANLLANLEPGERDGGFLAAGFTVPQIDQIARDLGIIVAEDRGIVVGCVCSLRPEFEHSPPAMTEMVRRLDQVRFGGRLLCEQRPFVYGPVVIDRAKRGSGGLRGLYQRLLQEMVGSFDVGVALVAEENRHSVDAHVRGLGMTAIGGFECGGRRFLILAFSVSSGETSLMPPVGLEPTHEV